MIAPRPGQWLTRNTKITSEMSCINFALAIYLVTFGESWWSLYFSSFLKGNKNGRVYVAFELENL